VKKEYHLKLIEFYQSKSKYEKFAYKQCVYHFKQINENKKFVEFLRSKKALLNIEPHLRSFIFNVKKEVFLLNVLWPM
jgi:hypothetical protein